MRRLPPDRLRLPEAIEKYQKYGFTWKGLRIAIRRGRLKGFKVGYTWYVTDRSILEYIDNREEKKIPKRYKGKS